MRFNVKKLEAKGFHVVVGKDAIEIIAPPTSQAAWVNVKDMVENVAGVKDPALQEYAMGAFFLALQRAQILEVAE